MGEGMNNSIKKGVAVAVILLFVSVSVVPSTGTRDVKQITMSTAKGDTLYVGGSGSGNYSTIQEAVRNATNGDTIFVYNDSSPYYEIVSVYKSISLIGEDRNSTVIDGSGMASVVYVSADGVKIRGFTIQNSGNTWDDAGIIIWSNNNILSGNIVTNNFKGIYLEESSNNIITGNIITNSGYYGILIEVGVNNIISRNSVTKSGIKGTPSCNIIFMGCNNSVISENNLARSDTSILLVASNKNNISGNNIKNNKVIGIEVGFSNNNNFFKNNFLFNIIDVVFGECNNNKWYNNFWKRPRFLPKLIFGIKIVGDKNIPWFNIDWRPALKPHKLPSGVMI